MHKQDLVAEPLTSYNVKAKNSISTMCLRRRPKFNRLIIHLFFAKYRLTILLCAINEPTWILCFGYRNKVGFFILTVELETEV